MREWLSCFRAENKMTQEEVSNAVGISRSSYCNIENGGRNPSVETAKKIAEVLHFDWTRFYADVGK